MKPESKLKQIINVILYHINSSICRAYGHSWAEEYCDGENGRSTLVCTRCGETETCQF